MNTIKVLDCTLRDGGYCNQWRFGFENITKVVTALDESGIDIIECGFLTGSIAYDEDTTKFTELSQIAKIIPEKRRNKLYVCMINYGEIDIDSLPNCDKMSIDGIRLAFHKKDLDRAMEWGKIIVQKGYKLFLQAMVSLNYTDEEFLSLIKSANDISPYAFYIVDSFGEMKRASLTRLFYLTENNLKNDILIGYHSHNNMQTAFANAQVLLDFPTKRTLIIDASVYGMGRGAGNLNTELLVNYLNDTKETAYSIKPLLKIIDEVLVGFYGEGGWGYSLPNYLSAAYHCHPNYARYLDDKKTMTVESMNEIFSMIDPARRNVYDRNYIEALYLNYMGRGERFEQNLSKISQLLKGKRVLVIAPGKSSETEHIRILQFAALDDVVTISINFDYPHWDVDLIFISNLKRFQKLDDKKKSKCIITSNIPCEDAYIQIEYTKLLNDDEFVRDNAGMMLLNFLIQLGVKDILLAGMDGYSHNQEENYALSGMQLAIRKTMLDEINRGMEQILTEYSQKTNIQFLTTPRYIHL